MAEGLKLQRKDLVELADTIKREFDRRRSTDDRRHLEIMWDEVDRQIAMKTKTDAAAPGNRNATVSNPFGADGATADWHSDIEMPLQAYTFETLLDDAARMLFPMSDDWFEAHAVFDDEWATRMAKTPIHPGDQSGQTLGRVGQEEANALSQSAMNWGLTRFNFRENWKLSISEIFRYGNCAIDMRLVQQDSFTNEYRGTTTSRQKIPAMVPISMRNFYLDDGASWSQLEGFDHRPTYIRTYWRNVDDLKRQAAKQDDAGWYKATVAALEANPDKTGNINKHVTTKNSIQIIEWDGDVVLPRVKRVDAFLPNQIVTVALSSKGPEVIRWRENPYPFRTMIIGNYLRDDINSPYGTSPLMKGQPLQEFVTATANQLSDAAHLNAQPPVTYNWRDQKLVAEGGPRIEPRAQWASSMPNDIKAIEIGDLSALMQTFQLSVQMYKDLTGVDDPRARGETKSHTTRFANEVAVGRNALRTEECVNNLIGGPITSFAYIMWYFVREALKGPQRTVFINTRGYQGHILLSAAELPEQCDFIVKGASGVFSKRERQTAITNVFAMIAQYTPLRLQIPPEVRQGMDALATEAMRELGISAPERFLSMPDQQTPGNAAAVVDAAQLAEGEGDPSAPVGADVPPPVPAQAEDGADATFRRAAGIFRERAAVMAADKTAVRDEDGNIEGVEPNGPVDVAPSDGSRSGMHELAESIMELARVMALPQKVIRENGKVVGVRREGGRGLTH